MDFDAQFDSLWESILDVGREPATGGYRRFAWNTADLTLREWFTGEAAASRHDRGGGPQRQHVGLVDAHRLERGPEGRVRHRISSGLGARRRRLRRAPRRGVGVPRGRSPPRPRCCTRHPDRRRRIRRRGGCPVRRGLRRVAAEHRGTDAPTARCALRDNDGTTLADALRDAGRRPEQLGADDTLAERVGVYVELHVEQGRALAGPGSAGGRRVVDLAARQMAPHLRR